METLLFVGGDLSGIQKFLYNITSTDAAVSLKGRSAYLVDYTARLCKDILALPEVQQGVRAEQVYCSGGKFYLFTEDTPAIRQAIDQYAEQAEKDLWQEHKGQLGLAIAYIPFAFTDTTESEVQVEGVRGKIGLLWQQINSQFMRLKNRKFAHLLETEYETMFSVLPVGGDVRVCAVTGIEAADCVQIDSDEEEKIWVLPSVKRQIERGRELRNTEHFKTFAHYAHGSYLGVLRMDVDGMGARIQKGFRDMEEYRAFSNKLQSFFEGKDSVLRQLQRQPLYRDSLNIIYAGGDDLFVVGQWEKVLEFAADIRVAFEKHTAGEGLHISGGMAIVSDKFPIAKAAEMAGEAEEQAKAYSCNGVQKNAFCFLGQCVNWDKEFDQVRSLKDEFYTQIKNNGLSKGILHQMVRYSEMAEQAQRAEKRDGTERKSKAREFSYLWQSVYYLTRMRERYSKSPEVCRFINRLRNEVPTAPDHGRLIALSARWAELSLRDDDKENNSTDVK